MKRILSLGLSLSLVGAIAGSAFAQKAAPAGGDVQYKAKTTYDFDDDAGGFRPGRPIVIATLGDYVYELLVPTFPRFRDVGRCVVGLGGRGGLGSDGGGLN